MATYILRIHLFVKFISWGKWGIQDIAAQIFSDLSTISSIITPITQEMKNFET